MPRPKRFVGTATEYGSARFVEAIADGEDLSDSIPTFLLCNDSGTLDVTWPDGDETDDVLVFAGVNHLAVKSIRGRSGVTVVMGAWT